MGKQMTFEWYSKTHTCCRVKDYKIIRGLPADVEATVSTLLKDGWQPHGSLFKMPIDGQEIVVQNMILYEIEENQLKS